MKKKILAVSILLLAISMLFILTNTAKAANEAAQIEDQKYDTLYEALASDKAKNNAVITLLRDIKIEENGNSTTGNQEGSGFVIINTGESVTIEMNGHSIESALKTNAAFRIENGSTVTIKNSNGTASSIKHTAELPAILVKSGTLTLEAGVTCETTGSKENSNYGAIQVGVEGESDNAKLIVDGATVNSTYQTGIALFGSKPSLEVKSGKITGKSFAIAGNGKAGNSYTVTISGGTITSSDEAAIYQPNPGTLTITEGDITGKIGIVARRGTVDIKGGTVTATGDGSDIQVGDAGIGDLPSGVAIIVDNKSESYDGTAKVIIEGGKINASNDEKASVFSWTNSSEETITDFEITGGAFNKSFNKKFVKSGETEVSITDGKGTTTYYVGLTGEDVAEIAKTGSIVTVMQGEMDLDNLEDKVTVKTEEGATATVNGYEVTETGVDTTVLNKLQELEELLNKLKEELEKQGLKGRLEEAEKLIGNQNATIEEIEAQIANLQKQYNALKAPEKAEEKDNTPGTGVIDVALISAVVAMISALGIVTVKKYNK